MIEIKVLKTVVLNGEPELFAVLGWVKARWDEENLGEFTVTSMKDGEHMKGSQHKQDVPEVPAQAVDIRTRHHFDYTAQQHHPNIVNLAKELQKEGLKVVLHPDWLPGPPHLHLGLKQPVFVRES